MNKLDKILGALFGFAIGDALGGTTEFHKEYAIKQKYGYLTEIIGGGPWNLKPGETTDDTAMTLALAEGILENQASPIESIGKHFLKWFDTNPKDVGNTVRHSMLFYKDELNWEKAALKTDDYFGGQSAGNGTLMRCLPIPLIYNNLESIERISINQSKMTHYDDLAAEACVIYNKIAFDILWGKVSLKKSIETRVKDTLYEKILVDEPDCLPNGFVVNTFLWVLRVLYTSKSYEEVVQILTNKGEDADTTSAIAGGLKGLEIGFNNLPERYVESIIEKERIHAISLRILKSHQ